ncbi:hypothetical protein AB0F88_22935 [Streptosporangium sp. NPDC023963]|uniref:hypothetical protein n=1 Tax=Streptosporangium sp. NPDC023963 TaxID=3155608 RepID=UPI003420D54F
MHDISQDFWGDEWLEAFDRARALQRLMPTAADQGVDITVHGGTDAEHARVEWSGTFTPRGATDEETIELFHGIYADGLAALKRTLGI